ncbi:MAG: DUF1569 domain-containing protein [Spirosomaceae bacterium]|nr:DUF1569 domain-containing protein [Spirosomataceae bacterium]
MATSDVLNRLSQLTPDSQRLWGSMSVNQMLTHVTDQIRICLGELPSKPRGSWLTRKIVGWIAVNIPLQMPKNMKTIAELDPNKKYMTQPTDFQEDFDTLIALYNKMLKLPETHHFEHPVFGKLSKKEVIKLTDIHLDHHLRQFGA